MPESVRWLGVPNGRFDQNSYLLWDPATSAAVVIDPGEEPAKLLELARQRNLSIGEIWLTHAHLDHIWGVDVIRGATGARVLLHPADRPWYDRSREQAIHFGITDFPMLAPPDGELHHGDRLTLGSTTFEVRHVPGHAPGHVAFIAPGLAVSGDILFHDSIGRTDLPGGDLPTLLRGIREQLLTLPDETQVLTGHGPETTIGRERRLNPFLND